MKRWWVVIALLLSLGVNVGLVLSMALERLGENEARLEEEPVRVPPEMRRLVERLGLEGQERERFVEAQREFFRTVRIHRPRLQQLRRQLHRELTSRRPDEGRIEEILEDMARTSLTLEKAFVKTALESRRVLAGEQERRYVRFLTSHLGGDPFGFRRAPRPPRDRDPRGGPDGHVRRQPPAERDGERRRDE